MNETYIYVIAYNEAGPVKIGYSENPDRRVRQLQTGQSNKLVLYYSQGVSKVEARKIEKQIHATNGYLRSRGEWFNMSIEDAIVEVKHGLMSAT